MDCTLCYPPSGHAQMIAHACVCDKVATLFAEVDPLDGRLHVEVTEKTRSSGRTACGAVFHALRYVMRIGCERAEVAQ